MTLRAARSDDAPRIAALLSAVWVGTYATEGVTPEIAAYVLAEGIFADEVVRPCRDQGLLADAVCIHNPRLVTFWRRLSRDLRESRKPPWVLVRRGVALLRAEPEILARARAAGCLVLSNAEACARLRALVNAGG